MFIGRDSERKALLKAYDNDESNFIAIYGRRRIGKTFLVKETLKDKFTFIHTGGFNLKRKDQLKLFSNSLKEQGLENISKIDDWIDAFENLKNVIKKSNAKKKVIFLDELSWLDTSKSGFISALESFWNGWCCFRNDILLIVCASSASWIINKIIHNRGGLYNRLSNCICLKPFTLKECKEYLFSKGIKYDEYQILQLYMVLGGVPFYYSFVEKGKSASQNINSLFFEENAKLRNEFDYLYQSIFNNYEDYLNIVKIISTKKSGINRNEIAKLTKLPNNGELSKKLVDLQSCGFIKKYIKYGNKSNDANYQLIDNFTLFYYSFLYNKPTDNNYWLNNINNPKINTWEGLAFELVALQHINNIKEGLGIRGVSTNEYSWYEKENNTPGCQIDLLIERKDRIINICEIKFKREEYTLNKKDNDNIINKEKIFLSKTKVTLATSLVLITTYGLKENQYSSIFNNVITCSDLFKM